MLKKYLIPITVGISQTINDNSFDEKSVQIFEKLGLQYQLK